MRFLPFILAALVCACPPSLSGMDAALPDEDAGPIDAGTPDAGRVDGGFVAVPIEQWCQLQAFAQCDRSVRCLELALSNQTECIAKKSELCDQTAYTRAAKEGRMQYLSTRAAQCLNGYAGGSCRDVPTGCEGVFAGKVVPDGGCILLEECNGGGFCYAYDYTCPHRCRGWIPLGVPCDGFSARCSPEDAYCGTFDGGTGQRCQPLKGVGEECIEYDACRTDLTCANKKCIKRRAGPGEPCREAQSYPDCSEEYFCRQSTAVTPPPPGTCERRGGLGAVCAGFGSCLPSLRCGSSFSTSTCVARAAVGEKCSSYGECEEGLYCPPRTSRCAQIPSAGADCTSQGSYSECASAHFCDFSAPDSLYTCRPRRALGDGCTYDGVCLSNDCEYGTLPDGGYAGICVARCSQKADGGL